MRPGGERKESLGEAAQEDDPELQALGLVHGQDLHASARAGGGLRLVHRPGDPGLQVGIDVREQRSRPEEAFPDRLQVGEGIHGDLEIGQLGAALRLSQRQPQNPLHDAGLDQDGVGERRQRQPASLSAPGVEGGDRPVQGQQLVGRHVVEEVGRCRFRGWLTRACGLLAGGRSAFPGQRVGGRIAAVHPVHQPADHLGEAAALLDRVAADASCRPPPDPAQA